MGGVVKTVLKVASVVAAVALAIPSGGTSLLAATLGVSAAAATGIAAGLALGSSLLFRPKAPKTSAASMDRLQANIDPRAPRKFVLGRTAMATDIRDQEFSDDQSRLHRFIVLASHQVAEISELWLDDKLAWTATGGITSEFDSYLGVEGYTLGSAANAKNISPRMGATRRYTGLAYLYLRFKLTGNSKKSESPFAQSVPSRVTIVGKGALCYDPRRDSTVPGGSGSMRANNQSTWAWDDNACRNPAIQLLWYLLGWRIQNPATGEWRLAVGKGIPAARIDIASFITAANLCDEPVTLASGGTQPRYRSDALFSEADATSTVLDQLKAAMNAELDDVDGKIRITVLHNDLATPVASFSEDDVLSGFTWEQTAPLDEMYNVVRGTYIDPSDASLYQSVEFPEVRIPSPDGIDRIETVNFQAVQDARQAQRLAKQRVARMLYSGRFSATFSYRAWKVQKNDVIRLSFAPLGWTNKLFRVVETAVQVDGQVPMVLQVENADIYLWDRDERASVQPVQPTSYDPYLNPVYQDVADPKYDDGTSINDLRPAEPGATDGMSPDEAALFAQLELDTAQALINIAAAEATITQMQGAAAAIQADLSAAEASIIAQGAAISAAAADINGLSDQITAAGGEIDTLQTTVGNHGSSITSLQTTVSNHTGTLATHTSQISTANANISANATAITTANTNIANLTVRVGSAESSISTNASAITTLQGSVASLTTRVNAGGNPNLLPNGGFENGGNGWDLGAFSLVAADPIYGPHISGLVAGAPISAVYDMPFTSAGHALTVACDASAGAGVTIYLDMACYDAGGALLAYVAGPTQAGLFNFSSDNSRRALLACALPSTPAGIARVRVRCRAEGASGGARFRLVKLERGATWTPYSNEASVVQSFTAISTLNGQYASLNTTVSTHGASITSLLSASSTQAGQIASLQTGLSTANANISTNSSAITGLNTSVATINGTLSTQGASITTLQSAVTTLQGDTATLKTQVTAGNPNLAPNGGFENGLSSWTAGGQSTGGWSIQTSHGYGSWAYIGSNFNGSAYLQTTDYITVAASTPHTLSADSRLVGTVPAGSLARLAILYYDASNTLVGYAEGNARTGIHNFTNDGSGRLALAVTATSQPTAVKAKLRLLITTPSMSAGIDAGFRQVKFERGSVATAYSNEASVTQSFQALSTLTTQYASLSTTVGTQGVTITSQQTAITTINGNIATLFGRWGFEIDVNGYVSGMVMNNNGSRADLTFRSDKVRFIPPGGNGSDGKYIVIDSSGRTTDYILSGGVRVVEIGWIN